MCSFVFVIFFTKCHKFEDTNEMKQVEFFTKNEYVLIRSRICVQGAPLLSNMNNNARMSSKHEIPNKDVEHTET